MKDGWQSQRLGQLCQLISGQHIDSKNYNVESRGVGYLTGPADFGPVSPVISKWTEYPKVKARSGDILITVKGSGVGKINLLDRDEVAISRQLMAVRVTDADPRFVYAFLSSTVDSFQALSTGAAIPGISREQVLGLEIKTPPLPEQRRIVAILDKAFDSIATAKADAEKNLQNARALFEGHLQAVFTQRGNEWLEKRLKDVCVLQRGFDLPTRSRTVGEFPLVSSSGVIDTHNHGIVKGPGVVTGRSGSIGNIFFVEKDFWPLNTVLYVKQFFGNDPKFVYWLLGHFDLKRFATGTGVPTLNRNFVHDEVVRVPTSPTLQRAIADQFDSLATETQRLESIYERKLAALDELKKSLLHQAFTGQL